MNFLPAGLKGAIFAKVARWGGTLAGGVIAGYLASHTQVLSIINQACSSLSSADAMKAFAGAAAVALVPLVSSILDAKKVDGKMAVTASAAFDAGLQAQAGTDVGKLTAVAQAMQAADTATKQERTATVQALKTGSF